MGRDWIAKVHYTLDREHAAIREAQRELDREQRQAEREAFQEVRQRAARVDAIVSRGLTAVGLYRQDRHQWKRRLATMKKLQVNAPETEQAVLDLGEITRFAYVSKAIGLDGENEEKLHNKLEALYAELIGPGPVSAAVRLAAELVCFAWLDTWNVEITAIANPPVSPNLDRRRNWSQRRYQQALTSLERIRKLTRPRGPRVAVQIVNQPPALEIPTFELPKWKKFED